MTLTIESDNLRGLGWGWGRSWRWNRCWCWSRGRFRRWCRGWRWSRCWSRLGRAANDNQAGK